MAGKKSIAPEAAVEVGFTARERVLVLERSRAGPNLTGPLAKAAPPRGRFRVEYALHDLDDLIRLLAAEANRAKEQEVQRELARLSERLRAVMET